MTFHYFWGVVWEAFRRGQLLSNRFTFDDVSLVLVMIWNLSPAPLTQPPYTNLPTQTLAETFFAKFV